jgi:hypothetical protein
MELSEPLIIRELENVAHILNPYTGALVSLRQKDFEKLKEVGKNEKSHIIFS